MNYFAITYPLETNPRFVFQLAFYTENQVNKEPITHIKPVTPPENPPVVKRVPEHQDLL